MTKQTERILELEARLGGAVPSAEFEAGRSERPRDESAQATQPPQGEGGWPTQETVTSMPLRTAQAERRSQKSAKPQVARRRISRPVVLALVTVAIIAIGMIALGVASLASLPSTSQKSATCTMTTSGGGCQVGQSLYVTRMDVATTPYNGSYVMIIVLTINNTGTNPITITAIQFDNTALLSSPPSHGGIGNGLWSSSVNPIAKSTTSQIILNVPATSPSSLNGAHTITLVDSSGTSYAFSVTISVH